MKEKTAALLAAVILVVIASAPPAQATIIHTYTSPDATYISATNLIAITTMAFANASSWTDGTVTATSSQPLNRRDAEAPGGGWDTWSASPESERTSSGTLPVLYAMGLTSINFTFDLPLYVFGVELEPDVFGIREMTLEYFAGATSLGIIQRSVDGVGGARVFAGITDMPFDRASISIKGEDPGFALAQLRYSKTQPDNFDPVPEPSPALMVAGGAVLLLFGYYCRQLWKKL